MYRFILELEDAEDRDAVKDALARVAELLEGESLSGDLKDRSIGSGHWELVGECPENVCDGSGETADPEGGSMPCICKKKHRELDALEREEYNASH